MFNPFAETYPAGTPSWTENYLPYFMTKHIDHTKVRVILMNGIEVRQPSFAPVPPPLY